MLSIVIPTFNELKHHVLQKTLHELAKIKQIEVICVDYQSSDGTIELIQHFNFNLLPSNENTRAARLNQGIQKAQGNLILLHHPRSHIDSAGIEFLAKNAKNIKYWGAFTHKFDQAHILLDFTSIWSNYVRGDMRGIYYLDHCLFAPKELLLKVGLVPLVDIFEDTLLSKRLKKMAPYKRLSYDATTSAVRFRENGIWKQALINQWMKIQFYFNRDLEKMNQNYERGLDFNSKYSSPKDKHE